MTDLDPKLPRFPLRRHFSTTDFLALERGNQWPSPPSTLGSWALRSAAKNGGSEGSARQSTIHHQLDRVDVRRIVRGKKKHSLGQIFRLAPTGKWNRGREEVGNFCGFLCRCIGAPPALPDGSPCRSRGHHVHANFARCKVCGDGS